MSLSRMTRLRGNALLAIVASAALLVLVKTHVLAARRSLPTQDAVAQPAPEPTQHSGANPVIVELFTSEGCSSCPPADALLARLQQDQPVPSANIITLEEHVDYWDHLGWRDRFSSPYITQRQRSYQSAFHLGDVFTPQFIVNGSAQFDGTDPSDIEAAIAKAAAVTVRLELSSVEARLSSPVNVRFTLANSTGDQHQHVSIYSALVDPQDMTDVPAGENKGRTLHHVDAVRALAKHEQSHMNDLDNRPTNVQLLSRTSPVGMRLVVFAQTIPFGPILGAAVCTITRNNFEGNDFFPGSQGDGRPLPMHAAPSPQDACPPPQTPEQ